MATPASVRQWNDEVVQVEFRRLLEKLPAAAYLCDPDGLITFFNEHARTLWGREPRLGDPIDRFCGSFRLFEPDGAPIAHERCWMALALREQREYNGEEIVIERPCGDRRTVLAHANPIYAASGELVGAVNVLIDITDRKRGEEALRQADRSKNQFLATLAHELRNPLSPIRNAVEILHGKCPPDPDVQWALGVIDRQMHQMTRLVDDLLDLARISRNKLELKRESIDLADVLRAAEEISRPAMDAGGHAFRMALPERPLWVYGDLTRLAQVVSNLLNNAARYTEPGGHIWLTAERDDGQAVVRVRDDGRGIGPEQLPRIFEQFSQGGSAGTAGEPGLGIGLSLARWLVDMHEGSLDVQSDGEGQGSEFVVRLALVGAPARNVERASAQQPAPERERATRVLVVDDNADAADSLSALLELRGHRVRTAYDGPQALEAASEFRPEVVLLDIGMPGMSGHEVARALRELPECRDATLIAVTGWGHTDDVQKSREAGCDHHLVKPVDPTALLPLLIRES